MSLQTRHFVLTAEGSIREFSAHEAAQIAAGSNRIPEFAGHNLRYLQLTLEDTPDSNELRVQTAGARVQFDEQGRLTQGTPPTDEQPISRFEHDAVVQWALRDVAAIAPTFH
ncbi:hypothetical protein [Sinimarinibacterium sp. NLF-5-8]|uniref:hypothetical protein n=1 Tax=Sinimarinibacterium sp. NLF-5-8 TaxID=2698684 RepID=UPI00137BCD16|nr:hypothetical protein [Sinimarinibacterium sp. NLF-5-8]QHS09450.1 hypothetical protein GT972_04270 [Sinimarinibacterium sp. NLF-5-8]